MSSKIRNLLSAPKRLMFLALTYAAFPVYASSSHNSKVADGMGNLISAIRAWIAVIWNLRIVGGLLLIVYGGYSWYRAAKMEESTSVSWFIGYTIAGTLLTLHGSFELFGEIFGFSSTVDPITIDSSGRANVSANTTYTFKEGTGTQPAKN
jgi:hypothetical protein